MSALWDWAVAAYARPGAAEACLALQDERGQNVPLLLWALWSARSGRTPDIERGARIARAWEDAAGAPLRAARRGLKGPLYGLDEETRIGFRERVKALELEGERLLLEALERTPPAAMQLEPEAALLARLSTAWGAPQEASAFEDLLARL